MRIFRRTNSLRIAVSNRELKEVDNSRYLANVLARVGYCTMKIKTIFFMGIEAISLLISRIKIGLRR